MTGEASVTSRPDRVTIDLGVVTRGAAAQQAATENARAAQNVLASLRKALGPRATVETISYVVQPDYQYPPQGGEPTITGYTATNLVRVTQDDLSNVGAVIDTAARAGANQVNQIRFLLKDDSAAKANALRGAAFDARAKANSLASALGLQVVRIHSVDESSPTPRPLFDLAFRSGASTPILPGGIETTATVTLAVEFTTRR
ncbi:MAG TPA: SIMPL domain-containing protein [Kofleriaceae bacterium]|nr:SIMPL domain-containing protein [Kofleriaceae bacterium]